MDTLTDTRMEVLRRFLGAVNARDIDVVRDLTHPEMEVKPTYHWARPGTTYHGFEGFRSLFEEVLGGSPKIFVTPGKMIEMGRFVLVPMVVSGSEVAGPPSRQVTFLFEVDRGLVRRVLGFRTRQEALEAAAEPAGELTPREREVFGLLAQGFNAREVAERLVLSPATVRTHVQNGIGRLGAKTRVQAIAMAITRGEISP
jgi:DNA-binding CsgD family transcriptional regulator